MKKIQIYEEIPEINLINIGGSRPQTEDIKIFESENKTFEFIIENVGNYPIENIWVFVYAYKRDDYKILLEEIDLSQNEKSKFYLIFF